MAPRPTYDLVLMAGQSNMLGYRVFADDFPAQNETSVEGAEIWVNGKWVNLALGAGYQAQGFGPEIAFAQSWTKTHKRPLRIVKVAKSGSSITHDWSADQNGGPLYQALRDAALDAMQSDAYCLRGLLWMQGETEAQREDDAQNYRKSFERFISRIKNDLGTPDLPVIAAQISPPEDRFPFLNLVRKGLRRAAIDNYARVDVKDLPKQDDRLHLTGEGLCTLGERFSQCLTEVTRQRPFEAPSKQWIWKSQQYQAWYEGPSTPPRDIIVSLPHADDGDGYDLAPFGQAYFLKRNMAAIYVRASKSNWFQDDEIIKVAEKIRSFAGRDARLATYGASMGGYGALLLSGPLNALRAIAVCPQYSIDRAQAPFETRWAKHAKAIGSFKYDVNALMGPQTDKIVVYDPLNIDRKQIALFETDENWREIKIPVASHQAAQRLLDHSALPMLFEGMFENGPNLQEIKRLAKRDRTNSKIYWLTLANHWAERKPDFALYAIDRCEEVGGPPRKLKKFREKLLSARAS